MIHRLPMMIGSEECQMQITCKFSGLKRYVRGVPEPFYGGIIDRIRDAIAVIKGEAFAVRWPEPGELEFALKGYTR